MLYLKLSRNQGQEWSSVTVSSLAKKLIALLLDRKCASEI